MMMAMNRNQSECLGNSWVADEYHYSYKEFHPEAVTGMSLNRRYCDTTIEWRLRKGEFDPDEEEQSFADFVDFGRRNPNKQGTGRWKMNGQRKKILIVHATTRQPKGKVIAHRVSRLVDFLSTYLMLPIDSFEEAACLNLDSSAATLTLGDTIHSISVWEVPKPRKGKKEKVATPSLKYVDVFSLFDALVSIATRPYISVVCVVDCLLGEGDDESGRFQEVMGRACGDRVCCVSLPSCESLSSLLCTTAHEALHTLGFDHCNSFRCLMNAYHSASGEEWPFLSPPNLRKLKLFHTESKIRSKVVVRNGPAEPLLLVRYRALLGFFRSLNASAGGDVEGDEEEEMAPHELAKYCAWLSGKIRAMVDAIKCDENVAAVAGIEAKADIAECGVPPGDEVDVPHSGEDTKRRKKARR